MPKTTLTTAAVQKLRPEPSRREIPDGGCKGLSLIIHPSGAKSWAMRFRRPDGRGAKLTLGPVDLTGDRAAAEPRIGAPLTLAAARRLAMDVGQQRALGLDVVAEKAAKKRRRSQAVEDAARSTFPGAARAYVEQGRRGKERNRGWRTTAKILGLAYPDDGGEPTAIEGGLAERWRDRPVAEVTADDMRALVEEARLRAIPGQRPRRPGPSDSRARDMATTLKAMFRWIGAEGLIQVNPCANLRKPDPAAARDRVLNADQGRRGADELRWFWTAATELGEPFGPLFKLLLLTGARRREVSDMRWSELSDDLTTWALDGSRTKNGRPLLLPLSPAAQDLIRGMRRIAGPGGYVFTTNGSTPVSGFTRAKTRLDARVAELAGPVAIVPWRLHDLRRTAATGMAEIGVSPHVIEAALNHISGHKAGVAGVYNRATYLPEKKAALAAWADYVTRVVEGGRVVPFSRRNVA